MTSLEAGWLQWSAYAKETDIYFDSVNVSKVASRISQELLIAQEALLRGEYRCSPFLLMWGSKASGGARPLAATLNPIDGAVSHAILNALMPVLYPSFEAHAYAYRPASPERRILSPYEHWSTSYSRFSQYVDSLLLLDPTATLVSTDIQNYYPSVDHDVLLSCLFRLLPTDKRLQSLLEALVRFRVVCEDGTLSDGTGLPVGPAISHLLANVYLSEFDRKWSQRTLGYSRYVDDMVLVLPSDESVDEALAELDNDLAMLGLGRSVEKTNTSSVAEPENVVDQIRKAKYRTGRLISQLGPDEKDKKLALLDEFFDEMGLDYDSDDSTDIITHMRFVLRSLDQAGAQEKLELAYYALQKYDLDASVCLQPLSLVMGDANYETDSRFRSVVLGGSAVLQVHFLRMVIEGTALGSPMQLVKELAESPTLAVRILAYSCLEVFDTAASSDDVRCHLDRELRSEHSGVVWQAAFGYAGSVSCTSPQLAGGFLPQLSRAAETHTVWGAMALSRFIAARPDRRLVGLFSRDVLSQREHSGVIELLNSAVEAGDLSTAKSVLEQSVSLPDSTRVTLFRLSVRRAYYLAARAQDIGSLANLACRDQWTLGEPYDDVLENEARDGLRSVVAEAQSDDMRSQSLTLLSRLLPDDSSGLLSVRDDGLSLRLGRHHYSLRRRTAATEGDTVVLYELLSDDGEQAVLEIADAETLRSAGYASVSEWQSHLDKLSRLGLTFRTQTFRQGRKVYTVYHVLGGFLSLEGLANVDSRRNEETCLALAETLGALVVSLRRAEDTFQSLGPNTVYLDAANRPHVVGLALGCCAPMYALEGSAVVGQGERAYQYFIALLLAQNLFRRIPQPKEDLDEFLASQAHTFTRPTAYIWRRLCSTNPERRYDSWELASADISLASTIRQSVPEANADLDTQTFELAAYLAFRLAVARRSPAAQRGSTRDYVHVVAGEYMDTISRETALGQPIGQQTPNAHLEARFASGKLKKQMTRTSQVLLKEAERYAKWCGRDSRLLALPTRNPVRDLLFAVLWIETESAIEGVLAKRMAESRELLTGLVDGISQRIKEQPEVAWNAARLKPSLASHGDTPAAEVASPDEAIRGIRVLGGLLTHPRYDGRQLHLATLAQVELATWLLYGRNVLTFADGSELVGLGDPGDCRAYDCLQAMRFAVDGVGPAASGPEEQRTWSELAASFEDFLTRLRPLRELPRRPATVVRYRQLKREGCVRFRTRFRVHETHFGATSIAGVPWENDRCMLVPATVDYLDVPEAKLYPAVVSFYCPRASSARRRRLAALLSELSLVGESRAKRIASVSLRSAAFVSALFFVIRGFTTDFSSPLWNGLPSSLFFLIGLAWEMLRGLPLRLSMCLDDHGRP